jgi:hypothetical protein
MEAEAQAGHRYDLIWRHNAYFRDPAPLTGRVMAQAIPDIGNPCRRASDIVGLVGYPTRRLRNGGVCQTVVAVGRCGGSIETKHCEGNKQDDDRGPVLRHAVPLFASADFALQLQAGTTLQARQHVPGIAHAFG